MKVIFFASLNLKCEEGAIISFEFVAVYKS